MLNSSHENPIQRGPGKRSGRTKVRRPLRQLQFENLERRELLTACLAAVPSAQSFTGTIGVSALLAGNNQHSGIGLVSAPSAAAASRSGLFAARAPAAPVLRATAVSGTQVNLSWNSVSGASGYLVDVWLNGSWMQLGSVGSGATGCSVTGLSPGTTYYFDVGAYNAAGTSWANYRSVTTIASLAPPAAPSFKATAASSTQINVSWNSVSGASGYLVDEWINGAWSQVGSYGSGATGCSVTGLSANTTYYFDVAAYNAVGTSWASYQSATTSAGGAAAVSEPAAAAAYTLVSGSLFGTSGAPSYLDVHQGEVGDCWLMASLAEVAARDPADIQSMFTAAGTTVENGATVNLYTVRLFNSAGVAGYFTVDTELPAGGTYYDQATNGVLWVALAEKAYAEANGANWVTTGSEGSDSYNALNGGDPAWALQAITGKSANDYVVNPTNIASAWNAGQLIVLGSSPNANDNLVVGDSQGTHAYAVVGYNATSSTPFELYNPWGISSVVGSTIAYNGRQVYGGPFYANATLISQDFAFESFGVGAEAGVTNLGSARIQNLAAANATMAERPGNDAGDSSAATGYPVQQNQLLGVPAGAASGESLLNSTMVAKDAGITDYLYREANRDWSLAHGVDPWGKDWLLVANTSI